MGFSVPRIRARPDLSEPVLYIVLWLVCTREDMWYTWGTGHQNFKCLSHPQPPVEPRRAWRPTPSLRRASLSKTRRFKLMPLAPLLDFSTRGPQIPQEPRGFYHSFQRFWVKVGEPDEIGRSTNHNIKEDIHVQLRRWLGNLDPRLVIFTWEDPKGEARFFVQSLELGFDQ